MGRKSSEQRAAERRLNNFIKAHGADIAKLPRTQQHILFELAYQKGARNAAQALVKFELADENRRKASAAKASARKRVNKYIKQPKRWRKAYRPDESNLFWRLYDNSAGGK